MSGLFTGPAFVGFGPLNLNPLRPAPELHRIQGRRAADLRSQVRVECPRCPGVYGMLDESGALIYIGKAKRLRARLMSYFRPKSRDPKAGRILGRTRTILWECAASEFGALLRELEFIQRWQPRYNVQGQPFRRRRTYVCLGRRPAPYIYLRRRPPTDARVCFGPIPATFRASEAVRRLNDYFRLRDCSQSVALVFADQGELFPVLRAAACMRHEIHTCLGPCAGACSRQTYARHVRQAEGFLDGSNLAPLDLLLREMKQAAGELAFERRQAVRDKLDAIRWMHEQLDRLRQNQERHSFIYPVQDEVGSTFWYLLERGRVAAGLPAPATHRERQEAADCIERVYAQEGAPLNSLELDQAYLVSGWFRRFPEEPARALKPAEVLAACRVPLAGSKAKKKTHVL